MGLGICFSSSVDCSRIADLKGDGLGVEAFMGVAMAFWHRLAWVHRWAGRSIPKGIMVGAYGSAV